MPINISANTARVIWASALVRITAAYIHTSNVASTPRCRNYIKA